MKGWGMGGGGGRGMKVGGAEFTEEIFSGGGE